MPQSNSIIDSGKKFFEDTKRKISAGSQQSEGLGNELAARTRMKREADSALAGAAPSQPSQPSTPSPSPQDKVGAGPYGSRPGEKRIDTSDMTRPLGSFAKGTDSVPKTGVYKVHEGEKIVSAKDNKPMATHYTPEEKAHFHRSMHALHSGALHRHLGIPEGEPIPMEKKQEAANSDNPHVAAMGRMAVAMSGWKHHGHNAKD